MPWGHVIFYGKDGCVSFRDDSNDWKLKVLAPFLRVKRDQMTTTPRTSHIFFPNVSDKTVAFYSVNHGNWPLAILSWPNSSSLQKILLVIFSSKDHESWPLPVPPWPDPPLPFVQTNNLLKILYSKTMGANPWLNTHDDPPPTLPTKNLLTTFYSKNHGNSIKFY